LTEEEKTQLVSELFNFLLAACFFYHTFVFEELTTLYSISDVLLINPKRDGMNHVEKEYIATRTDYLGTLIYGHSLKTWIIPGKILY